MLPDSPLWVSNNKDEAQRDTSPEDAGSSYIPPIVELKNNPPLHIKLGLMKNFVKSLDMTKPAFAYMRAKYTSVLVSCYKDLRLNLTVADFKTGQVDGL